VKDIPVVAENVILAGDIFSPQTVNRELFVYLCNTYKNVVFVLGNHEFYDLTREKVFDYMDNIGLSNFHWLEDRTVEIDGVKIAGSSLWFPYPDNFHAVKTFLNDFIFIDNIVDWVFDANEKSSKYLYDSDADIIVTHTMPCSLSVNERYRNSPINCFFLSDETKTIREKKPKFWIHGHTHHYCRYNVYNTEVVCNPFGYIDYIEEINDFEDDCKIEL